MTARSVASVFLAMAATNDADIEILMGLLKIMAGRLAAVVLDMNAQEVANMIWSVARLATKDFDSEALVSPLALLMGRVPHVVSAMNAQEVANAIWALAKLSGIFTDSAAFLDSLASLARQVPVVISEMKAQEVANVIWATAKLVANRCESGALMGVLPVLAVRIPAVVQQMTLGHNLVASYICTGKTCCLNVDRVFRPANGRIPSAAQKGILFGSLGFGLNVYQWDISSVCMTDSLEAMFAGQQLKSVSLPRTLA